MTQNVLVICGSLRADSLNRMICNTLPELAPEGMSIMDAPGLAEIPLYNADVQASGFPDAVTALGDAVRAADGVIVVTPEYNFSVPGGLKNAIDWVSRLPDQPFAGKAVAIQSAAAGMLGGARGQYHLRQIMVFLEALVLTKPEVFVSFGAKKVDLASGTVSEVATREAIVLQLKKFSEFIHRVGPR